MEKYLQIAKVNLKYNLAPHIIIALLTCILAPFIMGVKNLNQYQTAQVLERYISLIGIVLCVPLFTIDQNKNIFDLLNSKKEPVYIIQFIRLLESALLIVLFTILFLLYLKNGNCKFEYAKYLFGTLANCFFLGGLGTLTYSLTDNIATSYMIPILYYTMSFALDKKYFSLLYLFSMMQGTFIEKYYLFTLGFIMLAVSILYRNIKINRQTPIPTSINQNQLSQ